MKESCRFLISLSAIYCIVVFSGAASINKQDTLSAASKILNDGKIVYEEEKEAPEESRTSLTAEATMESLPCPECLFLKPRATESKNIINQRKFESAPAPITYGDEEEGEQLPEKKRILPPSTSRAHVTSGHRKHRRRPHCRKRFGVLHSERRNINKKKKRRREKNSRTRMNCQKDRKIFWQRQRPQKNLERQLLVGNRSLELFRQELAAAAKASKKIGPPEARKSSKFRGNFSGEKVSNGNVEIGRKGKNKYAKRRKEKFAGNFTSEVFSGPKRSHNVQGSLSIEDHPKRKIHKNFTNDDRKKKLDREVQDRSRKTSKEEMKVREGHGRQSEERIDAILLDGNILASIPEPTDDRAVIRENLDTLRSRIFNTFKNSTILGRNSEILRDLEEARNSLSNGDENENVLCLKGDHSKKKLEEALLGALIYFPSCPCRYPTGIFYDDKIWDKHQEKYFFWREISNEREGLKVHNPKATYCVRSLFTQGSKDFTQDCCYDDQGRLQTRDSGGTSNFVIQKITTTIDEKIDILPRKLCKGDFIRFNRISTPDDDDLCRKNSEDENQQQIENTVNYRIDRPNV